jgi:hypothetical protein
MVSNVTNDIDISGPSIKYSHGGVFGFRKSGLLTRSARQVRAGRGDEPPSAGREGEGARELSHRHPALQFVAEHRDISLEQLQVQQKIAKKIFSEDEEKCHKLFRLTKDNKDETYEWYKNRVEDRVGGTCQWFLNHEHFQKWLEQDLAPLQY